MYDAISVLLVCRELTLEPPFCADVGDVAQDEMEFLEKCCWRCASNLDFRLYPLELMMSSSNNDRRRFLSAYSTTFV